MLTVNSRFLKIFMPLYFILFYFFAYQDLHCTLKFIRLSDLIGCGDDLRFGVENDGFVLSEGCSCIMTALLVFNMKVSKRRIHTITHQKDRFFALVL